MNRVSAQQASVNKAVSSLRFYRNYKHFRGLSVYRKYGLTPAKGTVIIRVEKCLFGWGHKAAFETAFFRTLKLELSNRQKLEVRMRNSLLYNKPAFIGICVLQVLYGLFAVVMAVVLNAVVDAVSAASGVRDILSVGAEVICFVAANALIRMAADSTMVSYAAKAAEHQRKTLAAAIFSMDYADFSKTDSGEYLNTITQDVNIVQEQYYLKIPAMVSYVAQFIACVAYSIYLNPVVALVLLVMSSIQFLVPHAFGERINAASVQRSERTGGFTSKLKELLFGFSVIKSYGAEKRTEGEFAQANEGMTQSVRKVEVLRQVMMCTNLLIAWLMILISVLTAGYFVMRGTMSAGSLLAVFYIANRYSSPLMDFAAALAMVKSCKGIRKKLHDFTQEHPIRTKDRPVSVKQLSVDNLSFAYREGEDILNGVSCTFEHGKKYLILGESGCGKSTLLKLLAGYYPSEGIYADGRAYGDFASGELAGSVILAGQQPYIFKKSVRENIDFLQTGDEQRLLHVISECKLSDFVNSLPDGIDSVIDEEVNQISGGQKARIGLARAVYAKPDILLLDEVTSALDSETAEAIEEMLLTLDETTVIQISHKPTQRLKECYDDIIYMDGGRIAKSVAEVKSYT